MSYIPCGGIRIQGQKTLSLSGRANMQTLLEYHMRGATSAVSERAPRGGTINPVGLFSTHNLHTVIQSHKFVLSKMLRDTLPDLTLTEQPQEVGKAGKFAVYLYEKRDSK